MEIIPNWHPVLVHFTVALPSAALAFTLLQFLAPHHPFAPQWQVAARWTLWLGAASTVATVAAGAYAFATVVHDDPGHAAMLEHRAWAVSTVVVLAAITTWSILDYRRGRQRGVGFLAALLLLGGMIGSTGWHGAELVYRHGIGVMRTPNPAMHHHTQAGHPQPGPAASKGGALSEPPHTHGGPHDHD